jgi:prevent-host-death family protein
MQTVTASQVKQNAMILQDAIREDLLITKRDKPYVVVMDYKKYQELQKYINKIANDETYRAIVNLEEDKEVLTYEFKDELYKELGL